MAARLLHGAGAGSVAYVLGIASNLVLLPLYLRVWSVAVYGEWMGLYSVVNYLGNLDFGVTAAAINAATMAYAREDWQEFKRVQDTAWAAAIGIAAVGAAVLVVPALFYFRVERWLNLRVMTPGEARVVFCCLAVALLANIPGRQLLAIYIAIGEFSTYQWLYNVFLLASCAATAAFLVAGAGPALLAIVTMGAGLSTIALSAWLLHRRDPRLLPRLRDADWRTARTLAAPTAQFGLTLFATVLTIQAPVVLLSRVLGGPAVALFTTTRTAVNMIRGVMILFAAPMRPEFAALAATHSRAALGRLFRFATSLDVVVGVSLMAALWTGGCWLIRFWSRGRIAPDPSFLHLILISALLEGFLLGLGRMGWATNRARALSVAQIATAVASFLLAVALVNSLGVSAVPLATIAPLLLILGPVAVRDACRHADMSIRFIVGRLLFPIAALGVFAAAFSQWSANLKIVPEWFSACVSAVATCAVALMAMGVISLRRWDRQILWSRIFVRNADRDLI